MKKIAIYLSICLHNKRQTTGIGPHKRKSSILSFFCFCGSFLPSWIRIQPTKINADPCGSRTMVLLVRYLRINQKHNWKLTVPYLRERPTCCNTFLFLKTYLIQIIWYLKSTYPEILTKSSSIRKTDAAASKIIFYIIV
jgi:hypothetical protein